MARPFVAVSLVALAGIAFAISVPVRFYAQMHRAQTRAAASLAQIGEAQHAFRNRVGRLGYATHLLSLTTPCPGDADAPLVSVSVAPEYALLVRAAENALVTGTDCHGRPIASDYYASAQPASGFGGAQAFAMTARGRIYLFFDGIAPREGDMGTGGLAVALDTLDGFKIP